MSIEITDVNERELLRRQLPSMIKHNPAFFELVKRHCKKGDTWDESKLEALDNQLKQLTDKVIFRKYNPGEYVTLKHDSAPQTPPIDKADPESQDYTRFFVLHGQVEKIDETDEIDKEGETKEAGIPKILSHYSQLGLFGQSSGPYYQVTTRIVPTSKPAILALFSNEAMTILFDALPNSRETFKKLEQEFISQKRIAEFQGQLHREAVIRKDKRHILAFIATLPEPLLVVLLGLVISWVLTEFKLEAAVVIDTLAFFLFIAVLWAIYKYVDWHNDDFIISTNRVVHIERTIIYGETREEAPLGAIQDVKVAIPNLFSRIFDYRNIVIQTAGVGSVTFDGLGNGNTIREEILAQKRDAEQRTEASNISSIRGSLDATLNKKAGVIDEWKPEEEKKKETFPEHLRRIRPLKAIIYFIPKVKESDGKQITWRKHHLILLKNALLPALLLFASLYALTAALFGLAPFPSPAPMLLLPLSLVSAITFFWYIYKYDTWRKDIYIVTDTNIIDIKGSPLNLGAETRREGPFGAVQNITYHTPSYFTRLFNMGNVVIETAGTMDTFTFEQVYDYKGVQQEVSRRLFAYKEKERQKARSDEEKRFTRWFGEYHEMTQYAPEGSNTGTNPVNPITSP